MLEIPLSTRGCKLYRVQAPVGCSGSITVARMDGAVFAANEVSEDFINRHTKRFGHASQIGLGALAYEFAQSLGRILVQNSQLSGDQLMRAFERLPRQESSVAGPYQLRNEAAYGRFFDFPAVMQRIEGEGFKALNATE